MTDSFDPRKAPKGVEQQQSADYDTLARLLQTTREKLSGYVLGNTELETLLVLEREKNAKLQSQLDAVLNKDTSADSK
jgi:hypothetical protein